MMQCLKCGRGIGDGEVFCKECLTVMEANPVKPGTPVVLPRREEQPRKAAVRVQPKPEDTIRQLEGNLRRLRIIMVCVTIVFALITGVLSYFLCEANNEPTIGSNYSTNIPWPGN